MQNALAFYHFYRPCGLDAGTAAAVAQNLRSHYLYTTRECAIAELAARPEWQQLAAELLQERCLLHAAVADLETAA